MSLFGSSRREKSATTKIGAGAVPPARPHGDLPELLRDSHTLTREVAKSMADAANIDAASLARNGGMEFENQPTVEVKTRRPVAAGGARGRAQ